MNHGGNQENDALIFLVFTDFESGRIGFPGGIATLYPRLL